MLVLVRTQHPHTLRRAPAAQRIGTGLEDWLWDGFVILHAGPLLPGFSSQLRALAPI